MSMPEPADLCPSLSRREARRKSRREAILEVAERLFLKQGYADMSMSAIVVEMGGSKGTLWGYFPAKDMLFAAVLDRATEAFQQQLTLILKRHDDVETALHRFALEFLLRVSSPAGLALYRLVMGETNRFPETGRTFDERVMGRTRKSLETYLAEVMTRDQLRRDDAQVAARQLIALCLAGCHQSLTMRVIEKVELKQVKADAAHAVATFMRAYGGSP